MRSAGANPNRGSLAPTRLRPRKDLLSPLGPRHVDATSVGGLRPAFRCWHVHRSRTSSKKFTCLCGVTNLTGLLGRVVGCQTRAGAAPHTRAMGFLLEPGSHEGRSAAVWRRTPASTGHRARRSVLPRGRQGREKRSVTALTELAARA